MKPPCRARPICGDLSVFLRTGHEKGATWSNIDFAITTREDFSSTIRLGHPKVPKTSEPRALRSSATSEASCASVLAAPSARAAQVGRSTSRGPAGLCRGRGGDPKIRKKRGEHMKNEIGILQYLRNPNFGTYGSPYHARIVQQTLSFRS